MTPSWTILQHFFINGNESVESLKYHLQQKKREIGSPTIVRSNIKIVTKRVEIAKVNIRQILRRTRKLPLKYCTTTGQTLCVSNYVNNPMTSLMYNMSSQVQILKKTNSLD